MTQSRTAKATGVRHVMRTSPVQPAPGAIKTIAMLAVPIVLPAVFAALLVYGWCTP